jgi:flagellar protein FlaI
LSEDEVTAREIRAKPMRLRKERLSAEEIYEALKEVLASRAARPVTLVDTGRGRTLETYSIGIAVVRIGVDESTGEGLYYISEPPMTGKEEALYAYVLRKLTYEMRPEEAQNILQAISSRLEEAAESLGMMGDVDLAKVGYYLNREIAGYGPIHALILDDNIEDIKCVGVSQPVIVVHRRYGRLGWLTTNITFTNEDVLADFVRRLAYKGGRGISTAVPYVDAQLPPPTPQHHAGMRLAATIGREITRGGSSFVIRKFPRTPLSLSDLIQRKALSSLMAAYLWYVAEQKRIFFAAGPTGSGKTTLLNAILGVLDPRLSYITIEDVFEIQLPTWRWTAMTTRRSFTIIESRYEIKIEDLVAMAMRMRPDYLIVGEVRTPEQLIGLLFSSTTGHGALTSIHAQDPDALLVRLFTMRIERSALDLLWGCAITQPVKLPGGLGIERRVVKIAEFVPGEEGVIVNEVFKWSPETDTFHPSSLEELWERSQRLQMLSESLGLSKETILNDIGRRARFLEENRLGFFALASRAAAEFYKAEVKPPERVGREVLGGLTR